MIIWFHLKILENIHLQNHAASHQNCRKTDFAPYLTCVFDHSQFTTWWPRKERLCYRRVSKWLAYTCEFPKDRNPRLEVSSIKNMTYNWPRTPSSNSKQICNFLTWTKLLTARGKFTLSCRFFNLKVPPGFMRFITKK